MQCRGLGADGRTQPQPPVPRKGRTSRPPTGYPSILDAFPTERRPWPMGRGTYRERNVVERSVGRLEGYRRIATRHDERAAGDLALVQLAAILMWPRERSLAVPAPAGPATRALKCCRREG